MSKNRNTFEKRRREVEKRQRNQDKQKKRELRKTQAGQTPTADTNSEEPGTDSDAFEAGSTEPGAGS